MKDNVLIQLVRYFLWLGATGFGGVIALLGYMERDLVERKKWFTKEEFLEGLTLSQLAPGPLASQLSIYLGWLRGGVWGATLSIIAFLIPSFIICIILGNLYLHYGGVGFLRGPMVMVGAAVVAIMISGSTRLVLKTIQKDWLCVAVWAFNVGLTIQVGYDPIWVIVLFGLFVMFIKIPPQFASKNFALMFVPISWMSGFHGTAEPKTLLNILGFFFKSGALVFGGGLVIVPFLYTGAVEQFHWINERQFFDAVAVAMITPGPLSITSAFIGYLTAGSVGAFLATVGTFLPCYLMTVLAAPHYNRYAKHERMAAFIKGVTAGAVGLLAGSMWLFARKVIVDMPTFLMFAAALFAIVGAKISEPLVIVGAGVIGFLFAGI